MITFLGFVVFATVVGIGALDGRSGLGLFAMYRSADVMTSPSKRSGKSIREKRVIKKSKKATESGP